MSGDVLQATTNGGRVPLAVLATLPLDAFLARLREAPARGERLAALFATRAGEADGAPSLVAVLADDAAGALRVGRARLVGHHYPALTPHLPEAQAFERAIAEQTGVHPAGHPWLAPLRYPPSARGRGATAAAAPLPGVPPAPFTVGGSEVHEVAVGPVHAGVIEPGHFRFQCLGERVVHLEIALGYQHRGVEAALVGAPHPLAVHLAETLAGDATQAHAQAYCAVVEALAGVAVPPRAAAVRAIALELERLANHTGDLGALAGDVAFLPVAAACGRLRGDFLNATARLCGSRLGRGITRPGGVACDLDDAAWRALAADVARARGEVGEACRLLFGSSSVNSRFRDTGVLTAQRCRELGVVGPASRASGVPRDVRHDHATGVWRERPVAVVTGEDGDVAARALVRQQEVARSSDWLAAQCAAMPAGATRAPVGPLAAAHLAVALVESWRGEACHVALTGDDGRVAHYAVVDPSLHNWYALAVAMRDGQISDFPLINKSFDLSYCGHDL